MKEIITGIYCIVNLVNGKTYVGSAINCIKRKSDHFGLLRKNSHINSYLQNSFNKYGESTFEFHILERTSNLLEKEQYWMNVLEVNYNIMKNARRNPHTERRQETRDKISKALKNKPKSEQHRKNLSKPKTKNNYPKCPLPNNLGYSRMSTKVKQYNLDGEFIQEYNSISEAYRKTGIHISRIHKAINLVGRTAGNFKWTK